MRIGEIIHRLRKERKMTLLELSQKSGVAMATLSRTENSRTNGTLKSHMDICKALEIDITELYKDLSLSKKAVEMRSKKTRMDISFHSKNASSEMLIANALNKKMTPLIIKVNKGGSTRKEATKIGIEKFIYIASGRIEANIGEEKYNLAKGDTLYFEASAPHYFKNTGLGEASLICVVCPPVT
jgi:transcriptional regulator with XRE-family HTH domain